MASVVGEGTYGKVYRAREKATGKIVALKKQRLHGDEEGVPPTTLREVSLLKMLSSDPHIVRLLELKQRLNKEGKTVLYLVFEYMDTDLKKYIRSFRSMGSTLPPQTVKRFEASQSANGSEDYDAEDRRPWTESGIHSSTQKILTLWYRAPEILLGATKYSTPVDMWSVGCIFAELITTQALFPGDSELQQLLHIFRLLGTPNEEVWPGVSKLANWHEFPQWNPQDLSRVVPSLDAEGVDLLSKMLQYEPSKRISAKKAMEHPYFDGLNKASL
ncbi:Cyclin-dependent kinase B2-2 [Acorus gramineus]|uniref:Cyclin-dependent kinase B2-2 n=1 Tax=Acorus gramineus TaxID=55184 RepID=A0AAV9A5K2_ACOGR|nr:Cyclin-dependent kinase B2-2 [Acorus gramineus]